MIRQQVSLMLVRLLALGMYSLVAGAGSLAGNQARGLSIPEILKREGPAIVMIEVLDEHDGLLAQASGVIIRADGLIATNFHVIEHACNLRVKVTSLEVPISVSSLLDLDKNHDIAIL